MMHRPETERRAVAGNTRLARIYLGLLVLGIVVPLSAFVPWLIDHGLDVSLFLDELFANPISSYFALDVLIAVPVLWVAVATDRTLSPRQRRLTIAGSCLGASVGLPLYLYLRERNLT
jgi:hypothetical protein